MNIGIRREYVRTDDWDITAKVSADTQKWFDVKVSDMSAGGLMFHFNSDAGFDIVYKENDIVCLDVHINPRMLHIGDIRIEAKAVIKSVRESGGGYAVGAEFAELPQNTKIHLDEVISWTKTRYGGLYEED